MSEYIRADKQILVAIFGISTSLLTGIFLGVIEVSTGYAIYSFMLWFILPVGALLAGLGAASGYYAGAKLFQQKPAGGILLNMVGASIGAFLVVHYTPYFMLEVDGIRVKEVISFWKYLDLDIRHTSLSLLRGRVSTGGLGSFWGYAYACLQLLGFSFGGFVIFAMLLDNPYCDKCSRYLKKTDQHDRYTSDAKLFVSQTKKFASLLDDQKFNDAIRFLLKEMGVESSSGHHLRMRLIKRMCPVCSIGHLDFIAFRAEDNSWNAINETQIGTFTEEQLVAIDKT